MQAFLSFVLLKMLNIPFQQNLVVSYFNFFYGRDIEENHYEFHELSLHLCGSALNFSVNRTLPKILKMKNRQDITSGHADDF